MPARQSGREVTLPDAAVSPSERRLHELEREVRELGDRVEQFETALSCLEIALIGGFFVKVWADPSGCWIAHCPTVRCVTQEETRDAALRAVRDEIAETLAVLKGLGRRAPRKDVPSA